MPIAHINGTELFYAEVGEGIPCLVMHGGLGFDHTYMHPWLDPLGDLMHLVYYDHRCNGRSGRPPLETLTFERLCADADALREHPGFEGVAVMGHSYGGFVALEYALRYPLRVRHLILLDTAPTLDYGAEIETNACRKGATEEQMEALCAPVGDEEEFQRVLEIISPLYWHRFDAEFDARAFARTVDSAEAYEAGGSLIEGWDLTPRLGEIEAPTLIVVGRDDFVTPRRRRAPYARASRIPRLSYWGEAATCPSSKSQTRSSAPPGDGSSELDTFIHTSAQKGGSPNFALRGF
jgi:proline iminopeptidase